MELGAICAILCAIAGTATTAEIVPFATLFANHDAFQDRYLTVRGFVAVDELGNQYLFPTLAAAASKQYSQSIDVLPFVDRDQVVPFLRDLSCAELYGVFHSYGNRYVPSGYLLSAAGLVKVKRVSSCAAQTE